MNAKESSIFPKKTEKGDPFGTQIPTQIIGSIKLISPLIKKVSYRDPPRLLIPTVTSEKFDQNPIHTQVGSTEKQ